MRVTLRFTRPTVLSPLPRGIPWAGEGFSCAAHPGSLSPSGGAATSKAFTTPDSSPK